MKFDLITGMSIVSNKDGKTRTNIGLESVVLDCSHDDKPCGPGWNCWPSQCTPTRGGCSPCNPCSPEW